MTQPALPLPERVNKLFASSHGLGAPEPLDTQVADAVSVALGRRVSPSIISSLRRGVMGSAPETDLLCVLARHFDAPRTYLWSEWDEESAQFDAELTLLLQMRDLGITRLAMRDGNDATPEDLTHILRQLPGQPHRDANTPNL